MSTDHERPKQDPEPPLGSVTSPSGWEHEFDELVAGASQGRVVRATYLVHGRPAEWTDPGALQRILDLRAGELSPDALRTLRVLDGMEADGHGGAWRQFKWRLLGLLAVQDVFDAPLYNDGDVTMLGRQWYFYYEAKLVLTEAVVAWLNGLATAPRPMLRLFLEFTLRQLYFYCEIRDAGRYALLTDALHTGVMPKWSRMMKSVVSDPSAAPVRAKLDALWRGLSESGVHAYHPKHSSAADGRDRTQQHIDSMFDFHTIDFVLQTALWAYCVTFPSLLTPVDLRAKFGYSPLVGKLVTPSTSRAVEMALGPEDVGVFRAMAENSDECRAVLNWYRSLPDLSEAEVQATWDAKEDGEFDSDHVAWAKALAKMRAIREMLAFAGSSEVVKDHAELNLDLFTTIEGWKELERRRRSRMHLRGSAPF